MLRLQTWLVKPIAGFQKLKCKVPDSFCHRASVFFDYDRYNTTWKYIVCYNCPQIKIQTWFGFNHLSITNIVRNQYQSSLILFLLFSISINLSINTDKRWWMINFNNFIKWKSKPEEIRHCLLRVSFIVVIHEESIYAWSKYDGHTVKDFFHVTQWCTSNGKVYNTQGQSFLVVFDDRARANLHSYLFMLPLKKSVETDVYFISINIRLKQN